MNSIDYFPLALEFYSSVWLVNLVLAARSCWFSRGGAFGLILRCLCPVECTALARRLQAVLDCTVWACIATWRLSALMREIKTVSPRSTRAESSHALLFRQPSKKNNHSGLPGFHQNSMFTQPVTECFYLKNANPIWISKLYGLLKHRSPLFPSGEEKGSFWASALCWTLA